MSSDLEQLESLCGLPRRGRAEWSVRREDGGFSFDLELLGERIVLVRATGKADLADAERVLEIAITAVDSQLPPPLTYVTVLDFGAFRGATRRARSHFIRRISVRSRMTGLIFCELSPLLGMMVGLGARLGVLKGRLFVVASLAQAVALAQELLGPGAGKKSPLAAAAAMDGAPRTDGAPEVAARARADPIWRRDLAGLSIQYEVIDGRILHTRAIGFLRFEHVDQLTTHRLEVLEALGGPRHIDYLVADLSGMAGASRRARRRYMESLETWNAERPLRAYIAYGAGAVVGAAFNLARLTMPFAVRTTSDLPHALELIDEMEGRAVRRRRRRSLLSRFGLGPRRPANRPTIEQEVDDVLQFISTIRWDADGTPGRAPVPPDHPFALVFDAIRLVKWELDELAGERRLALDAVRRGSMQQRALVEHIPDAVVLLDPNGAILLENETARRLLPPLQETDALGRVVAVAGVELAELDETGGAPRWRELTLDGPPQRVLELAGVALEDGSRVVLVREVTRERDAQRQLAQQERLAAVGQLAAGIAHDFNNLLQVITSSAELLLDGSDPAASEELVRTIRTQCERGSKLIRQILDFGRRSISRRSRIDLGRVLDETVALLVRTLPESIVIAIDSSQGPFPILGDSAQLQQVLTNLSLNARDAMPEGGRLTFSCSRRVVSDSSEAPVRDMPPGRWIEFSAADTGSGIPHSQLARVFEPFFTTKQPGAGSGLGLSQVYGIVSQHEGFVRCSNRPTGGAVFSIFLPSISDEPSAEMAEAAATVDRGAGQTILLVEDDEAVMRLTRRSLEGLGYRVIDAANGARALELLDATEQAVDLVISDVVMPEMGGFQLQERLRARSLSVRMLLMSGYPLGEELRERDLGADVAWLGKPFSRAELSRAVAELLARAT